MTMEQSHPKDSFMNGLMMPEDDFNVSYFYPMTFEELFHNNKSSFASNFLYGCLLFFGLIGNAVFFYLLIKRKAKIRIFLINLAISDLIVCCFTIGMEFGWRLTVVWVAGDAFCRFFAFAKTFGLFMAPFVVVAMSLDRAYVIAYPFRINCNGTSSRARISIYCVWILSFVCSIPQAFVFHMEEHPEVPQYTQCVTFNFFSSPTEERIYVAFGIMAMYVVPLAIIIVLNTFILWHLRPLHRSKPLEAISVNRTSFNWSDAIQSEPDSFTRIGANEDSQSLTRSSSTTVALSVVRYRQCGNGGGRLSAGFILYHSSRLQRHKTRVMTVKLSMLIVSAFVVCYTPYAILIMCDLFDPKIEQTALAETLAEGLLMCTLCFSTIMNPLLYGSYMIYARKAWRPVVRWVSQRFRLRSTHL